MWERGVRDSPFRGQQVGRWLLVTATMMTAAALVVVSALEDATVRGTTFRASPPAEEPTEEPTEPAEDATPAAGERTYTLDGTDPGTFPAGMTGLAFLDLEYALEVAEREFGPAHDRQPDLNESTANIWHLPGAARFVAVSAGEEPDAPVVGLLAAVPPDSSVRFGAYGGVVLGRSSPADIAEAWGAGYDRSTHPGDDFAIRYVLCDEGWPVVVKFDHFEGSGSWTDDPVGRVLIAYADEDPAASGCLPA